MVRLGRRSQVRSHEGRSDRGRTTTAARVFEPSAKRQASRGARLAALLISSATLLALLAFATPALASKAKVGPLINVSDTDPLPSGCDGPNRDAEVEPTLAVNPRNSSEQVMAWMQGPTPQALTIVSANSSDGGRSWEQVLVPDNTLCTGGDLDVAIDPWLTFGPKGTAYLSSIAYTGDDPDLGVTINRSTDNGASWSQPSFIGGPSFKDKEAITADRGAIAPAATRSASSA